MKDEVQLRPGTPVLILRGEFAGDSGICLGEQDAAWSVSPDSSDRVLAGLRFGEDFELLIDLSADASRN
jgi:hypothetical protein